MQVNERKQGIAVLGSTGSIGLQTLDIMRQRKGDFEVITLTANNNWELLAMQAAELLPDSVVISNKEHYSKLSSALAHLPIKVYAGEDAICQVVQNGNVDTVVNALVGYAGLEPSLCALGAGKKLALANKESLVVAGELVMKASHENRAPIVPIDSEHSAVFQCLVGESTPSTRIILTASGGPFLNMSAEEIAGATVEQALAHPHWAMGKKITIDSATLMNKGFEVIEAHWLFGMPARRIDVVVHPQCVVHSLVEFADGALKAQLGSPDMHLPIQYALSFPQRWELPYPKFDITRAGTLTFEAPDKVRFPALSMAYDALERGGNSCCVLNAANEVAVEAFLGRRIGFGQIVKTLEHTLAQSDFIARPTLDDYRQSNREARRIAGEYIRNK